MQKNKKKIWILIVALAISVGLNLYFFGWKALERKAQRDYLRGVNAAVSQVIAQAQKGKVIINTGNGQLILIPVDPNKIGGN